MSASKRTGDAEDDYADGMILTKRQKSVCDDQSENVDQRSDMYVYHTNKQNCKVPLKLQIHTNLDEKRGWKQHLFKNVKNCKFAASLKTPNNQLKEGSRLIEIDGKYLDHDKYLSGLKVSHWNHDLLLETFARHLQLEECMSMTVITPGETIVIKFKICVQDNEVVAKEVEIFILHEGDKPDVYLDVCFAESKLCYITTKSSSEYMYFDENNVCRVDALPQFSKANFEFCIHIYRGIDQTDGDIGQIIVISSLDQAQNGYRYLAAISRKKAAFVVVPGTLAVGSKISKKPDNRFFKMRCITGGLATEVYFQSLLYDDCYLVWDRQSRKVGLEKIKAKNPKELQKMLEQNYPEAIFLDPVNTELHQQKMSSV